MVTVSATHMCSADMVVLLSMVKLTLKHCLLLAVCVSLLALSGCSPVGGGLLGGVLGAGAAGGGYEYHLKRQKDRVEEDFKAGKIDQKEHEIRKDQIRRDSLLTRIQ